jgi:hypothetical protein
MIDLDAIWTNSDELYCRFGVALLLGRIPYSEWKSFAGTYSFYRYVWPDNRYLNNTLLDQVYGRTKKTASEMMRFVLLVSQVEAHFTEEEQARMLSILITER